MRIMRKTETRMTLRKMEQDASILLQKLLNRQKFQMIRKKSKYWLSVLKILEVLKVLKLLKLLRVLKVLQVLQLVLGLDGSKECQKDPEGPSKTKRATAPLSFSSWYTFLT